ncbi:3'-5' exonuclease [Vibrio vulnificus]|uniref:3'-5' exonuclease n=1 Tax=Vibrio TaxID=662 RepID=UPI001A1F0914|nr:MULTISPECIES: 3'-5' exonuclease [Vibrio]EJU9787787.1 3'-5' exonuclease [Vibrio vulnificus]MCA3989379.1 3'-5' exonuclease [Vibrio vulnificus]MCE7622842.1 3'-5' exonuclease [Vibrio fluvialis]HAS8251624.1 3'-5' exonuclease [Vibrio vulnificus]
MNDDSREVLDFIAVDVEGNGQVQQEIIELAIVSSHQNTTLDILSWLIRPINPVTEQAMRFHGITNEDLESSSTTEEIRSEVLEALGKGIVVGHNVSVDTRLIRKQFGEWGPLAIIDTIKLAKYVCPNLRSYSLDEMIKEFNLDIPASERHRAAGDARATAQLFNILLSKLKRSQRDVLTLSQIAGSADNPFLEDQQGDLF